VRPPDPRLRDPLFVDTLIKQIPRGADCSTSGVLGLSGLVNVKRVLERRQSWSLTRGTRYSLVQGLVEAGRFLAEAGFVLVVVVV